MTEQSNGIENIMRETLSGDMLTNALDFAAYLKANDMAFKDGVVHYKDKAVCYMYFGKAELGTDEDYPNPWTIWLEGSYSEESADVPIDERMKEFLWTNCVNKCGGCGGDCSPGKPAVIFGKEFENVCHAVIDLYKLDGETYSYLKPLIEMRCRAIDKMLE